MHFSKGTPSFALHLETVWLVKSSWLETETRSFQQQILQIHLQIADYKD